MSRLGRSALIAVLLAVSSVPAGAWEAQTTSAGLAEQAALASRLHARLESLGFHGGLFEPLTIPPADAPALTAALHLLSPSQGSVPDTRGRETALSWIAAGAALADLPASQAANHFYDDERGGGWERPSRSLSEHGREWLGKSSLPARGVPAPDWVVAKDNPLGAASFFDQYAKAATAATPGERSRHMAAALVAAGAMLHVLGDLGLPARVRGDYEAQLDSLGGGPDDRGSRFERIAALAYGRLGAPPPSRTITRAHLRDYFTSKDGTGLADVIARGYFSEHTLPEDARIDDGDAPRLARALPALPRRLNVMAASRDGASVRDRAGTCLARYHVSEGVVSFSLDDDCMLEQVTAILPEVAAYETGLLDFLLRGELEVTAGGDLAIAGKGLGKGTIEVLSEDDRGVRTSLGVTATDGVAASAPANAGSGSGGGGGEAAPALLHVPVPATGSRVLAVFRGVDASGEPIVAFGSAALAR